MPNKFSPQCPASVSPVDKLVACEIGNISAGRAAYLRSLLDMKGEFTNSPAISNWAEQFNSLNNKLHRDIQYTLTEDETSFIEAVKAVFDSYKDKSKQQELEDQYRADAGALSQSETEFSIYESFKRYFPNINIQRKIITQLVSATVNTLDALESACAPAGLTREEILSDFIHTPYYIQQLQKNPKDYQGYPSGVDGFFTFLRRQISRRQDKMIAAYAEHGQNIPEDSAQAFDKLLNNADAWAAALYMAKNEMLNAEGIRINAFSGEVTSGDIEDISDDVEAEGRVDSAEETSPEHWQLKSDTISSFLSLTKEARSILYNVQGEHGDGLLSFPNLMDVLKLHQNLMDFRAAHHFTGSKQFIKELERLGNTPNPKDPTAPHPKYLWAKSLHLVLTTQPGYKQKITSFFNCYRKTKLSYAAHYFRTSYDVDNNGVETTRRFVNRRSNGLSKDDLVATYAATYLDIDRPDVCIFKEDGSLIPKEASEFKGLIQKLVSSMNNIDFLRGKKAGTTLKEEGFIITLASDPFKTEAQNDEERKLEFIKNVSARLNLHMTEKDMDILMNNKNEWRKYSISLSQLIQQPFSTMADLIQTHNNAFATFISANIHSTSVFAEMSPTEGSFRFDKSNYVTHTTSNSLGDTLENLGRAAQEALDAGDISYFRRFLEETYFNCEIYATKEVINEGTASEQTIYNIPNAWLRMLYEASLEDLNTSSSAAYRFIHETTRGLGYLDRTFTQFTERDNYTFTLSEYLLKMNDTSSKFGVAPLFVTGDSNSTRYLTVPTYTWDQAFEQLVQIAIGETKRMELFEDFKKMCSLQGYAYSKALDVNAGRYTIFEFLNDHLQEIEEAKRQDAAISPTNTVELHRLLTELLKTHLQQKLEALGDDMIKEGLLKPLGINPGHKSYTINPEAVFVSDALTGSESSPEVFRTFFINQKLHVISQLQFLTVDPGFYMGTLDAQKRYKEIIAAGDPLDPDAVDMYGNEVFPTFTQRVRYAQDIKVDMNDIDPDFMQALKDNGFSDGVRKEYGEKKKASLTDGQAYRTFESYRAILIGRGTWTKQQEAVYQRIMASRAAGRTRLSLEDHKWITQQGVIFQPLKPFYFNFEEVTTASGKTLLVPVQHKYSEFPLIPELMPEYMDSPYDADGNLKPESQRVRNKLVDLAWSMYKDPDPSVPAGTSQFTPECDMVAFDTCVKVGGWGQADISKANTPDEIRTALRSGVNHTLSLKGYRIQNNVPSHFNTARARGTQFTKHIFGGLFDSETKTNRQVKKDYAFLSRVFPKGTIRLISGDKLKLEVADGIAPRDLLKLINVVTSLGYLRSTNQIVGDLGTNEKVSKYLSRLTTRDARAPKDALGNFQINPEDGEFNISPAEGLNAADNVASICSDFRKNVIKQRIKGGSAVQVAGYGFEHTLKVNTQVMEGGKLNVTTVQCATAFDLDYEVIDENDNRIVMKLDYYDYVDPETCMLLDYETGRPVEPAEPEEGVKGREHWGWNTKLGHDFPGRLDRINYRIPTEKFYSIINCVTTRFLPPTAGSVIILPAQFTYVAGFDFDIDKLYYIMREYIYKMIKQDEEEDDTTDEDAATKKKNKNYSIWTKWYQHTALGRLMYDASKEDGYLIKAAKRFFGLSMDTPIENVWRILHAHQMDLIDLYPNALSIMAEKGKDISTFPTTKEDAYADFVAKSVIGALTGKDGKTTPWIKQVSAIDEDTPLTEANQAAINNLFFDIYQARLSDNETMKERFTPGGFHNLESKRNLMWVILYAGDEVLSKIRETGGLAQLEEWAEKGEYGPHYDITDLSTIAHYQTYNALYDALIGIAANQSINQRYTALYDVFKLKNPIRVGSMVDATDEDTGINIAKRTINDQDTELNVTEYLSAAVDAVKDALIEYFGISPENFSAACLLTRVGSNPTDIGLLFNQPVCRQALAILKRSPYHMNMGEALDEAMANIMGEDAFNSDECRSFRMSLGNPLPDTTNGLVRDKYVTTDALCYNFNPKARASLRDNLGGDNVTFVKSQLAVAHLVKQLIDSASEFNNQVKLTHGTSTNSIPSSTGGIQDVEQRAIQNDASFGGEDSAFTVVISERNADLIHIIDPYLRFDRSKASIEQFYEATAESPNCIEQAAFTSAMILLDSVIGNLFPYRTPVFRKVANALAGLTKRNTLNENIFNAINKDFMLFCLGRMVTLFNEKTPATVWGKTDTGEWADISFTDSETGLTVTNREFYAKYFSSYLAEVMKRNDEAVKAGAKVIDYSQIPILQAITMNSEGYSKGAVDERLMLTIAGIGNLQVHQKNILIDSWQGMVASSDRTLNDLARHLFMYSYYNNGFDFSRTSLMSLAPLAIKMSLNDKSVQDEPISAINGYRNFFIRVFNLKLHTENGMPDNKIETPDHATFTITSFLKALMLNHPEFYQFTKYVTRSVMKGIDAMATRKGSDLPGLLTFTLSSTKEKDATLFRKVASPIYHFNTETKKNELVGYRFMPIIRIAGADKGNDIIYMLKTNDDSNLEFNVIMDESVDKDIPFDYTVQYVRMKQPINDKDYSTPTAYDPKDLSHKLNQKLRTDIRKKAMPLFDDAMPDTQENVFALSDDIVSTEPTGGGIISGSIRSIAIALSAATLRKFKNYVNKLVGSLRLSEDSWKKINKQIDALIGESEKTPIIARNFYSPDAVLDMYGAFSVLENEVRKANTDPNIPLEDKRIQRQLLSSINATYLAYALSVEAWVQLNGGLSGEQAFNIVQRKLTKAAGLIMRAFEVAPNVGTTADEKKIFNVPNNQIWEILDDILKTILILGADVALDVLVRDWIHYFDLMERITEQFLTEEPGILLKADLDIKQLRQEIALLFREAAATISLVQGYSSFDALVHEGECKYKDAAGQSLCS